MGIPRSGWNCNEVAPRAENTGLSARFSEVIGRATPGPFLIAPPDPRRVIPSRSPARSRYSTDASAAFPLSRNPKGAVMTIILVVILLVLLLGGGGAYYGRGAGWGTPHYGGGLVGLVLLILLVLWLTGNLRGGRIP